MIALAEVPETGPGARVLHGSAVAAAGRGCLITGAAGRGKSMLARSVLALGATLVADDRVAVTPAGETLVLSSPPTIAGLLEVRGVGLLRVPSASAPLSFIVDLDSAPTERLPHARTRALLGHRIPLFAASGVEGLAATILLMLRHGPAADPAETTWNDLASQ